MTISLYSKAVLSPGTLLQYFSRHSDRVLLECLLKESYPMILHMATSLDVGPRIYRLHNTKSNVFIQYILAGVAANVICFFITKGSNVPVFPARLTFW